MISNDKKQKKDAHTLAELIAGALDGKKGSDISVLEVGKHTILADYFVIATGTSNTHVKALRDECEYITKEKPALVPAHIEGYNNDTWTLLDYGSVVVHIFTKDGRDFYKLEKLWKDADAVAITDPAQAE